MLPRTFLAHPELVQFVQFWKDKIVVFLQKMSSSQNAFIRPSNNMAKQKPSLLLVGALEKNR